MEIPLRRRQAWPDRLFADIHAAAGRRTIPVNWRLTDSLSVSHDHCLWANAPGPKTVKEVRRRRQGWLSPFKIGHRSESRGSLSHRVYVKENRGEISSLPYKSGCEPHAAGRITPNPTHNPIRKS